MEKGGPPPSSAASPLGLCRRAIPPQEHHQPCDDHTTENHRPRSQRHVHEDFRQWQQESQIQGLRQHGRTCGVHPQWEHHAPVFRSVGRRVLFHAVPPEPEQKKHRDPEGRRGPRHERQPFDEREKLHQQRRCARMRQQFRARQRRNRHGPGVDPVGRAELRRFQILERKPVKNHRDHEQVQHESKQKQRRERKEGDFLVPRHMIDEDTAEDHNGLRAHGGDQPRAR